MRTPVCAVDCQVITSRRAGVAVGLRKLTDKPASQADPKHDERLERDAAEDVVRRYQESERPVVPERPEPGEVYIETMKASVATDLQTPPPSHREFAEEPEPHPIAAPAAPVAQTPTAPAPKTDPKNGSATNATDSFAAALEALRATLRQPAPVPMSRSDSKANVCKEAPAPVPTPDTPIDMDETADTIDAPATRAAEEPASALERMPLPPPVEGPAQTPRPLYEDPLLKVQPRKSAPATPAPRATHEAPSMDNALQAVRNAVPGLRITPPKSDTPTNGREPPLSDGIPKSVSEDLPKYSARPKMRICGRCGHETKLRNAKCEKCARVDESLGILDAVIAGDLSRVEQVLLVRPSLITLRTSRHEWTLLHMAASGGNPKMVDLLLSKGASVNATNRDGKTALHYAAGKGHLGIVQALLKHFADPTMLYNGRSALDLARKAGHHDVADTIRTVMPEGDPNA